MGKGPSSLEVKALCLPFYRFQTLCPHWHIFSQILIDATVAADKTPNPIVAQPETYLSETYGPQKNSNNSFKNEAIEIAKKKTKKGSKIIMQMILHRTDLHISVSTGCSVFSKRIRISSLKSGTVKFPHARLNEVTPDQLIFDNRVFWLPANDLLINATWWVQCHIPWRIFCMGIV